MKHNRTVFLRLFFLIALTRSSEAQNNTYTGLIYTNSDHTAWNPFPISTTVEEQLPSQLDTAGNWGEIVINHQLGFRPDTNRVIAGQALLASVTLRNVSIQSVEYTHRQFSGEHSELCQFDIRDSFGRQPRQLNTNDAPYYPNQKWWGGTIPPMSQHRYRVRLDGIFDLSKPGIYTVTANKEIFDAGVPHNLYSGTVRLEILPDPNVPPESVEATSVQAAAATSAIQGNKAVPKPFAVRRTDHAEGAPNLHPSTLQPRTQDVSAQTEVPTAPSLHSGTTATLPRRSLFFAVILFGSALLLARIFLRAARRRRDGLQ